MILLLEKVIRGGLVSVLGDRYIKSEENENILYIDANNLFGLSMSQLLPYYENKIDKTVKIEDN